MHESRSFLGYRGRRIQQSAISGMGTTADKAKAPSTAATTKQRSKGDPLKTHDRGRIGDPTTRPGGRRRDRRVPRPSRPRSRFNEPATDRIGNGSTIGEGEEGRGTYYSGFMATDGMGRGAGRDEAAPALWGRRRPRRRGRNWEDERASGGGTGRRRERGRKGGERNREA